MTKATNAKRMRKMAAEEKKATHVQKLGETDALKLALLNEQFEHAKTMINQRAKAFEDELQRVVREHSTYGRRVTNIDVGKGEITFEGEAPPTTSAENVPPKKE